jgi:hypothetical protein
MEATIRDVQRVSVADTRQRVRMAPFLQKTGWYPGIPKDAQGWKGFLPAGKVHVPCRLEGNPSSQQGTFFNWKDTLPAGKVHVQWVDCYFWLLVLDSRDSKHKLEVTRLGQVVQIRF